MVKFDSYIW